MKKTKKDKKDGKDALAGIRIDLVRLSPAVPPAAFQDALCALAPELVGSLLTALPGDWYALASDVAPALLSNGRSANEALSAAGAIDRRSVDAAAFVEIHALRDAQARAAASLPAARAPAATAGVQVDAPTWSLPFDWQGRTVQLDWHLAAVDLPTAWTLLGGEGPGRYAGIAVGHIDTGYTEHPALGFGTPHGTWLQPARGVNFWKDRAVPPPNGEDTGRPPAPPEFAGPRDNLADPNGGHGTRTASLLSGLWAPAPAAGRAPADFPFFGAAPGVTVIPYRVTTSVLVDHVQDLLAAAVDHAVAQGVQVISISLGAVVRNRRLARAIDDAYRQGVIVCAAAGNVVPAVVWPGRFDCVVTVGGATTSDGRDLHPWRQASRGPEVDVSAPADAIRRATTVLHRGAERFLVTGPGDGTSFATALCAGIAVLWLARHAGDLDAAYGRERWARVEAFRQLAAATALVPPGWPTGSYGAGVVRAGALLRAALPALATLRQRHDA